MEYKPFQATVLRGNVYAEGKSGKYIPQNSEDLREALCDIAGDIIAKGGYKNKKAVSEEAHIANIKELAKRVSRRCRRFLLDGRFRIGTAQKYLNLKLKKMWCEGDIKTPPPHCPFDKQVIDALPAEALRGVCCKWTQSNNIADYEAWVAAFQSDRENLCGAIGLRGKKATMAEWERHYWKMSDGARQNLLKKYKKARRKKA